MMARSGVEVTVTAGPTMGRRDMTLRRPAAFALAAAVAAIAWQATQATAASATPAIRSGPGNQVPACVTPERLMNFIATRNRAPEPRFLRIAWDYKRHGEAWRVRWDYAFFQMVVETNYLLFRRANGEPGDVKPRQNNFAGLGTTGGGVPGDSYKDVSTGVLAQIQHLVAYSGERVDNPAGHRTRLTQNDVVSASRRIAGRRPVTFQDLSGRWAVDRRYGRTIDSIAERFSEQFCKGREPGRMANNERSGQSNGQTGVQASASIATPTPPRPQPARRPIAKPDAASAGRQLPLEQRVAAAGGADGRSVRPGADAAKPAVAAGGPNGGGGAAAGSPATGACRIQIASFGGDKALLIRAVVGGEVQLTALQVLAGFEDELSRSFIAAHAPGGQTVGAFASSEAAVKQAYRMCQAGRGG